MSATAAAIAAAIAAARAALDAMWAPGTSDADGRPVEQYATSWPAPRTGPVLSLAAEFVDHDLAAIVEIPGAATSYARTALEYGARPAAVVAAFWAAALVDYAALVAQVPVCGCHGAPQTGFITGPDGAAVGWFHDQAEAAAYTAARGVAA